MRSLLKKIIFSVIYLSGLAWVYGFFSRNRLRIVVYHRFVAGPPQNNLEVSFKSLEEQLAYLRQNYEIATLLKALNFKQKNQAAITIDDGDEGLVAAWKIFLKHQAPATLFLTGNYLDQKGYLKVEEIINLAGQGLNIESHTLSHPHLSQLPKAEQVREVSQSRQLLTARFNKEIAYFAYPYGKKTDYNIASIEAVKKAGYRAALTLEEGTVSSKDDPYQLKRLMVFDEPLYMFKVRLSGIIDDFKNLFL